MRSIIPPTGVAICLLFLGCHYDGGGVATTTPPGQGPAVTRDAAGSRSTPDGATSLEPPPPDAQVADAAAAAPEVATVGGVDAGPAVATDASVSGPADASVPDAGPWPSGPPAPASPPDAGDPTMGTCPDDPNLAVCLRFEAKLADESPNRLPVEGRNVRFQAGRTGLAAEIAAPNRIGLPESPALDAATITLEAQVNPETLGRRMPVVENPGQYGLYILASGSAMCSGQGGYALRSAAITPGRWTHVLCTFDATSITLWIDGQKAATGTAGPVATAPTQGLRIGWEDVPYRHFEGLIDNVRVWRVLRMP